MSANLYRGYQVKAIEMDGLMLT